MKVKQYRKKPVVIEAVHFSPDSGMTAEEIAEWCGGHKIYLGISIGTLEGEMIATLGDYIIKGIKGEFYPCKPDIFAAIYEEVTQDALKPKQGKES